MLFPAVCFISFRFVAVFAGYVYYSGMVSYFVAPLQQRL